MKSIWTRHIPQREDKDALELAIRNSGRALEALMYVLDSKIKKPKQADYESPSWAYFRADLDGYNRALEEIKSIITLDRKDKK